MSNLLLAFNNRVDRSVLSGGAWSSGLPLANLQDRILSHPARSTNALDTSTWFTVIFPTAWRINVVALCKHNLDADAWWRVRAFSDSGFSNATYDSGFVQVWKPYTGTHDEAWEAPSFWDNRVTFDDANGYLWHAILAVPNNQESRYWKIEISNTTNAAGYLQIGRLFMAAAWSPQYNFNYGASLQFEDHAEIEEAVDGTEHFLVKPVYRVVRLALDWLSTDEAMRGLLDLQRTMGVTGEVLFMWDPQEIEHLVRRSFLGRLRQLSPIENPYLSLHKTQLEIKELL